MAEKQKQDAEDRTGKYGGDDGAMENERADIQPDEDTGMTGTPTEQRTQTGKTQAEDKQDKDLETGEENPG